MNTNYTRITYQDLLEDFTTRLRNQPRFKNLSSASIYYLFMEMLSSSMDMTNFYMSRTAEEAFIDTAKLDSSIIKHAKNLGYNPVRKTPAEAELQITIKGPLPSSLLNIPETEKVVIYFSQEETDIVFDGDKYKLNTDYSYSLTHEDIVNGQSSSWSKTLVYSVPADSMKYYELQGVKYYENSSLVPIKIFQGEEKIEEIKATANLTKLGKAYQFYDIDDLDFSNWYSKRDPNGWLQNVYYKKNSYTKVGIGKNQEEALSEENLFDIEDSSIYLNSKLANLVNSKQHEKLKICSLTTNSDKTVRLRFGDGNIVEQGLNNEDDIIYVKYLVCNGAKANKNGSKGAELKINNKFYATSKGDIIDVTNNIIFTLGTDIMGGTNFEDSQSIKNNAPLYFASNNRLVTKQDFQSYFSGLTTPIKVKSAIAWGQDEIEDDTGNIYKYLQNNICYCLVSSLYNVNNSVHAPINILTDSSTNTTGTFSVYGTTTDYIKHLTDYIKMLMSYDSFLKTQYDDNPSVQWIKNIKTIRENAEPKMILNSKLFSLPPIVQYYDVVGTVNVNSLSKIQEFKRTVENEIYEWLENTSSFNRKIYKSDIIKFFNKHEETSGVNLDICVSDIVKSKDVKFLFSNFTNDMDLKDIYGYNSNLVIQDETTIPNTNDYNTITISKTDINGNVLTKDILKKTLHIYMTDLSNDNIVYNEIRFLPYEVYEGNNSFTISFQGVEQYDNVTLSQVALHLDVPALNDFASLSLFSEQNAKSYGLNSIGKVTELINNWIENSTIKTTANRPIPLPYTVSTLTKDTRTENIERKGIIQNSLETQLTEKSFWMYFIPLIIKTCYEDLDLKNKDINGDEWTEIDNLTYDLYTLFKATLADSVLDDNNNIVNYSMSNEIPVIRLNITYKYGN